MLPTAKGSFTVLTEEKRHFFVLDTSKCIAGCKNSIIPADGSVTSIGERAFEWAGIESIEIPLDITSIGMCAFKDCKNLTSIKIPSSVTSIGESSFWGCSRITSITISDSVTSISGGAVVLVSTIILGTVMCKRKKED